MNRKRTIYLAHHDSASREVLEAILSTLGHQLSLVTDSGKELIERALATPADLLVASPMLSDMDGIEALIQIGNVNPTPSIIVARDDDLSQVERAMDDHVMAYLVEPVTAESLQPAIFLCEKRFNHLQSLEEKVASLEQKLSDRKQIELAKGIIMQVRKLDEPEAHRFLQNTARRTRRRLVEVAKQIVDGGNLLGIDELLTDNDIEAR
ncbi:ANTAR domain-containing response regulator [Roseiconus lacunae]|uniref:ANTAR domain-containing protein n=1 Tax=Roseiconus lacunae TaxID=2605694 RepID=A0ABT7PLS6_9BACT|nr:ANTAR domain-containing protein [Roseiconus lacunae]MCD0462689.1 ANTAR domain-containing protein [Roseiconus lacunae]MDM4017224.1 ANTAR domain-containing protein [Roseiconus lacunae]